MAAELDYKPATGWGWPSRERLVRHLVGLYIDVVEPGGEAGAGWVVDCEIDGETIWAVFDWGYAFRIYRDTLLAKSEPSHPPFTFAEALT